MIAKNGLLICVQLVHYIFSWGMGGRPALAFTSRRVVCFCNSATKSTSPKAHPRKVASVNDRCCTVPMPACTISAYEASLANGVLPKLQNSAWGVISLSVRNPM